VGSAGRWEDRPHGSSICRAIQYQKTSRPIRFQPVSQAQRRGACGAFDSYPDLDREPTKFLYQLAWHFGVDPCDQTPSFRQPFPGYGGSELALSGAATADKRKK